MPGSITDGTNTQSFAITQGRPPGPAQRVKDISRTGVDGMEFRQTGVRATPGQIRATWYAASWSAAQSDAAGLEGMVGSVVTFTDVGGQSFSGLVLQDVQIESIQRVLVVGATGTHRCRATLTLRDTATS